MYLTQIRWRYFFFWSDLDPTYPTKGFWWLMFTKGWHMLTPKYHKIPNDWKYYAKCLPKWHLYNVFVGQLVIGLDVSPMFDIWWVHQTFWWLWESDHKMAWYIKINQDFHQFIRIQSTTSCRYLLNNKCRWSFPSPPKIRNCKSLSQLCQHFATLYQLFVAEALELPSILLVC